MQGTRVVRGIDILGMVAVVVVAVVVAFALALGCIQRVESGLVMMRAILMVAVVMMEEVRGRGYHHIHLAPARPIRMGDYVEMGMSHHDSCQRCLWMRVLWPVVQR